MSADTFLEAIRQQQDDVEAAWRAAGVIGRRAAVLTILSESQRTERIPERFNGELLAQDVARRLRLDGARRAGRGAVAGSWSGYMSPALRVVPILRALEHDGLVQHRYEPDERTRSLYRITTSGIAWLAAKQEADQ